MTLTELGNPRTFPRQKRLVPALGPRANIALDDRHPDTVRRQPNGRAQSGNTSSDNRDPR